MNTPISSFYDYFPGPALTPGMTPILGAGKLMELEDDIQYMKQLYPGMCKQILRNIEECCDHLEYEGSILFDSYPDKVTLERMAKEILDATKEDTASSENMLPLTTILLYQEILYRRARYRSRKRLYL
ncbi:MAG: hypothetical protein ACI4SQ_05585 [Eubacterium sp.]